MSWDGSRFMTGTASNVLRVYELRQGAAYGVDSDNDGAPDSCDIECRAAGLSADTDDDGDGILDVDDPDADGDGVADEVVPDGDGDGLADSDDPDLDNDGILNADDAYPEVSLGTYVDRDRDGAPDTCDSLCESLGMLADEDDDGDGVLDVDDQFPTISLNRLEAVQLGPDLPYYASTYRLSADGLMVVFGDPGADTETAPECG